MSRRLLALALAPLLLVGFTSCGSDGDDALSADEYKAEANSICAKGSDRIEALGKDIGEDSSKEEIRSFLNASLDEIQEQSDQLRDLEGPDDLEGDVRETLDDADEAIKETRDRVKDDLEAAMESDDDPFDGINERFVELGLDTCGEE